MLAARSGDIVVTSSVSGHQAIQWEPVYSASKHAIQSFVHGLRRQVAPRNVRVGAVAPGMVLNPLWGYHRPRRHRRQGRGARGPALRGRGRGGDLHAHPPANATVRDLVILPQNQDISTPWWWFVIAGGGIVHILGRLLVAHSDGDDCTPGTPPAGRAPGPARLARTTRRPGVPTHRAERAEVALLKSDGGALARAIDGIVARGLRGIGYGSPREGVVSWLRGTFHDLPLGLWRGSRAPGAATDPGGDDEPASLSCWWRTATIAGAKPLSDMDAARLNRPASRSPTTWGTRALFAEGVLISERGRRYTDAPLLVLDPGDVAGGCSTMPAICPSSGRTARSVVRGEKVTSGSACTVSSFRLRQGGEVSPWTRFIRSAAARILHGAPGDAV